jgi:taurine transport system ATP-binding protein
MMTDTVQQLTLSNVSLSFAGSPILEGIDLLLASDELVVVVGASGSGKTSMLRLAAGFQSADSGTVQMNGHDVAGPGAERAVVFQDDALFPWLNARDNVAFPLRLQGGIDRAERIRRADAQLAAVGLEGYGTRRLWQLSGGQRQRVGLARALVVQPAFLLMDEPFAALDALTRAQMQVALLEVWSRYRQGVLFITHDIDEALLLATKLVVLSGRPARVAETLTLDYGRRVLAGATTREIRADPQFQNLREQVLDRLFLSEPAA